MNHKHIYMHTKTWSQGMDDLLFIGETPELSRNLELWLPLHHRLQKITCFEKVALLGKQVGKSVVCYVSKGLYKSSVPKIA